MANKKNIAFNFGKNWQDFSKKSLTEQNFKAALDSLEKLIGKEKIKTGRFLDIGCGSGIFSIAASCLGAKEVVGIDISKESVQVSLNNKKRFSPKNKIKFIPMSIFDKKLFRLGKFNIVYSWGAFHHTGNMWKAINISTKLVSKNGLLVIAIYNKHWSSLAWKFIKKLYNLSPKIIQLLMIKFFYWLIAIAKFLATGKNPFSQKRRGMDFYHDVVDWLGGYPYEYTSFANVKKFLTNKGFKLLKYIKSPVPTGCNEFIFIKTKKFYEIS